MFIASSFCVKIIERKHTCYNSKNQPPNVYHQSLCIILQAPLREMDSKSLEEEYEALLSDKAGEAEYLQSLQLQIAKLMVLRNIHAFPER